MKLTTFGAQESATKFIVLDVETMNDTRLYHRYFTRDPRPAPLIRVPFGEPRGAIAKASLQRLHAALANDVMDVAWYDHDRKWTLQRLASGYALPADWDGPDRQMNTTILERELSAKAQSIWLSIAHEWLSVQDLRRALADYDVWRTQSSIV